MGRKKIKTYSNKFSKGQTIHRTKAAAQKVADSCKAEGIPYRIRNLKDGYRVDKKY